MCCNIATHFISTTLNTCKSNLVAGPRSGTPDGTNQPYTWTTWLCGLWHPLQWLNYRQSRQCSVVTGASVVREPSRERERVSAAHCSLSLVLHCTGAPDATPLIPRSSKQPPQDSALSVWRNPAPASVWTSSTAWTPCCTLCSIVSLRKQRELKLSELSILPYVRTAVCIST